MSDKKIEIKGLAEVLKESLDNQTTEKKASTRASKNTDNKQTTEKKD